MPLSKCNFKHFHFLQQGYYLKAFIFSPNNSG